MERESCFVPFLVAKSEDNKVEINAEYGIAFKLPVDKVLDAVYYMRKEINKYGYLELGKIAKMINVVTDYTGWPVLAEIVFSGEVIKNAYIEFSFDYDSITMEVGEISEVVLDYFDDEIPEEVLKNYEPVMN